MAKLVCKDGTEINISDQTEQELRKAFGRKKWEHGDAFKNADYTYSPIRIFLCLSKASNVWCIFGNGTSIARECMKGTKEECEDYINSDIRGGSYEFRYNLFDKDYLKD